MTDYNTSLAKLRQLEDIQPHEWARLERARRTSDPRKLAALLPAWLKAHLTAGRTPARAALDLRTVLPRVDTSHSDPRIGYYFPGGQQAQLRNEQGPQSALYPQHIKSALMRATDDPLEYAARFCALNHLIHAQARKALRKAA
jgi:hypothetical protein